MAYWGMTVQGQTSKGDTVMVWIHFRSAGSLPTVDEVSQALAVALERVGARSEHSVPLALFPLHDDSQ